MGYGDSITIENAKPWLRAIMSLRQRPIEATQWRVVMSDPGPGLWVRK